jgi:glycolate oxidase
VALTAEQKETLQKTLPSGRVFFDFSDRPEYTKDATELVFVPDALFFAESEDDIVSTLAVCRRLEIPLIIRGAGTGYTGGALATQGGLLVSIQRLNAVSVAPHFKTAIAGPGAITADVMTAAEALGLFYPPDPASYKESTIGGNLAENAGGLRCKKYGVTKDYVLSVRIVTADGDTAVVDHGAPYGMIDLLIGSEGTLAVFTEATLALIDFPRPGRTIQATFDSAVAAASVVAEVIAAGIVPAIMEFMDRDAIDCSNQYDPANCLDGGAAMLLFETDGPQAMVEADRIMTICRTRSPRTLRVAESADQRELLWKARRDLSHAVKQTARTKTAEDVCVPPSRLPELVAYVAELGKILSLRVNCYGHAGDGNLHVNFLGTTGDEDETRRVEDGVRRLFAKTLDLGGTISGEHGIGITKKEYLPREFDPATISFMRRLRKVFDPENRLNPGKIFL